MDLDVNVLKALGSETRLRIVGRLKERRMTLTELASYLRMHASTVKEHLDFMTRVGLIEVNDEGRKWKYYSLTGDCRKLLSPFPSEIKILLPSAALLLLVGIMQIVPNAGAPAYGVEKTLADASKSSDVLNAAVRFDMSVILFALASVLVLVSAYMIAKKLVFLEGLKSG
ncbi:MAG: winged helix-turn-helix domain-containing protein [Candidatus Aenigmatarchaeota archaeon]